MRYSIVLIIGLAALPIAAQPWAGGGGVGIQVNDRGGRPVEGAEVVLEFLQIEPPEGPAVIRTSSAGKVDLFGLADGPWRLNVHHPDFMSFVAIVTVRSGKKPTLGSSALEKTGSSLDPLRVKLYKVSGGPRAQAAPTPSRPVAPPQPVTTPTEDETPREEAREEPQPAAAVPGSPPQTATDAPEPASVAEPEAQAAKDDETMTASGPAEPTPAALPEPEQDLAAAEQRPADSPPAEVSPVVAPDVETPPVETPPLEEPPVEEPPVETPPVDTPPLESPPAEAPPVEAPEIELPTVEAEPSVPERLGDPAQSPLPEPKDVAAATPPQTAEEAPAIAPVPEPEPEPEPQAVPSAPPPLARAGSQLRSYAARSCPECKPDEWAVTVEQRAGVDPSSCGDDPSREFEAALRSFADSEPANLRRFAGSLLPSATGGAIELASPAVAAGVEGQIARAVDATSACPVVTAILPRGARFLGLRLEARDASGTGDCLPGRECVIGQAVWIGDPVIRRLGPATAVYARFHNQAQVERTARLTIYFEPPSGWQPVTAR